MGLVLVVGIGIGFLTNGALMKSGPQASLIVKDQDQVIISGPCAEIIKQIADATEALSNLDNNGTEGSDGESVLRDSLGQQLDALQQQLSDCFTTQPKETESPTNAATTAPAYSSSQTSNPQTTSTYRPAPTSTKSYAP